MNRYKTKSLVRIALLALVCLGCGASLSVFGQNTYQVSRTWGSGANDWADIGSFANTGVSQYVVFTVQGHWCGSIISAQFRYDDIGYTGSSTNWMELAPSNGGKVYNGTQPVAIDIKRATPSSTSDPILARIRNLHGMCGGTSLNISIETNTTFTATSSTGSSGTVDSGYAASDVGWKFPVTTDAHAASTDGLYVLNTGNVGIGTTNPGRALEVKAIDGSGVLRIGSTNNGIGSIIDMDANIYGAGGRNFRLISSGSGNGSIGGSKFAIEDAGNYRFVLDSSGNVGIGTPSPSATLHLRESGTNPVAKIEYSNASTQALQFVNTNPAGGRAWSIGDGIGATPGTFGLYDLTSSTLAWAVDSSGVQTVQSLHAVGSGTNYFAGNLGIGTTAPSVPLHLRANIGTNTGVTFEHTNGTQGITIGYTGIAKATTNGNSNLNIDAASNGPILLNANGGSGNVGIGNPAPQYKLDVNGEVNASGLRINGFAIASSQWSSGSSSISYTGNVGIGTSNPSEKLEVAGSLLAAGVRKIQLSRSITGTSAGSFVNVGSLNSNGVGSYATLKISTHHCSALMLNEYELGNTYYAGTNTDWVEVPPKSIRSWANDGRKVIAVDVRYSANGAGLELRLRRTEDSCGAGAVTIDLETNSVLTESTTEGSGATVALGYLGQHGWYFPTTTDRFKATTDGLFVNPTGNVGIGVTSPYTKFHVFGAESNYGTVAKFERGGSEKNFYIRPLGNTWVRLASGGDLDLSVGASDTSQGTQAMYIQASNGNVGIGTPSPQFKLDVNGNTNVTGNITATGSIAAKYQDVAEWVPASEQLSAGTVVVLDSTKSNQVTSSTVSYDTRVAGVVSEQPGIALGEKSEGKVLVATTGRVRVKVDASKSPIHIGDLLVTSDVSGLAMKSEPITIGGRQIHAPGTLIGKALEPLEKGKGEILVLLSLQ